MNYIVNFDYVKGVTRQSLKSMISSKLKDLLKKMINWTKITMRQIVNLHEIQQQKGCKIRKIKKLT
jgi:hypothetical protein